MEGGTSAKVARKRSSRTTTTKTRERSSLKKKENEENEEKVEIMSGGTSMKVARKRSSRTSITKTREGSSLKKKEEEEKVEINSDDNSSNSGSNSSSRNVKWGSQPERSIYGGLETKQASSKGLAWMPEIEEGTPASMALKANANVRVTKLDKMARKLKGPAMRKFVAHAAKLKGPGYSRRGKPPRVPHHPIHWRREQTEGAVGPPSAETSGVVDAGTLYSHQPLPAPPYIDSMPTQVPDESSQHIHQLHERRWRRHRKKLKKKFKKRGYVKGKVIDREHELYTLSIAVMLGVRTSIGMTNGQLTANTARSVEDATSHFLNNEDFMTVEKYAFRPKGGDKTPPHVLSHTFKFKDYSPKAFAYIRRLFGVNEYDFLTSICGNANFIEFISNSKSGQFFFYSNDGSYLIKTMTNAESKFLRRILPHYFRHCALNPNTMLVRFFGMYRVKMYHLRRNVKFVIMNCIFDTDKLLTSFYDLKGSRTGRQAKPHEDTKKDNDLRNNMPYSNLSLQPQIRLKLRKQLERDCAFMSNMKIIDYSMLIGVYHIPITNHLEEGKPDNLSLNKRSRSLPPPPKDDMKPSPAFSHASAPPRQSSSDKNIPHQTSSLITTSSSNLIQHQDHDITPLTDNLLNQSTNCLLPRGISERSLYDHYFDEDDECSYLDGTPNKTNSTPHNDFIEVKKLYTAEQIYWPFQRFHDVQGRRRMTPIALPGLNPEEQQPNDTPLPYFEKPISNRKDAGLPMDTSSIQLPIVYLNASNQLCNGKIYYMGIIDILQQFNVRKRFEARYRRLKGAGWADASCVHPILYADRFLKFFDEYSKSASKKEGDQNGSPARKMPLEEEDEYEDEYDDENVEEVVFYNEEEKIEVTSDRG